MPWKVITTVNERMHFVSRLEAGEKTMSELCREYGISRKTGYKFWDRYLRLGPAGLYDQSKKPHRSPKSTSLEMESVLLDLKRERPHWGASKLRSFLLRKNPDLKLPSIFTIHRLLDRNHLVDCRKGSREKRAGQERFCRNLARSEAPNDLWCTDFKGQFRLGNSYYCYPLTLTDHFSRLLLKCEGLDSTREQTARAVFEDAFREYGLPFAMRSDNGTPFSSHGLFGFSQLSVWWLRLGIEIQRSEPGHPEQNGRHERMHLTLKKETTRPASSNFLQQQERFDLFQREFNEERPHEALGMKTPSDLYVPSSRIYPKELPDPSYPLHDLTLRVQTNGIVSLGRNFRFSLGAAMVDQLVGLREEDSEFWRVSFMKMDLGFYHPKENRFEPLTQPQRAPVEEVLPMSP